MYHSSTNRSTNSTFIDTWTNYTYNGHFPASIYRASKNSKQLIRRMGVKEEILGHNGCVNTVHWNKQGDILLSGSDDRYLNLYSYPGLNLILKINSGHKANIFNAKFIPHSNDSKICSCSGDGIMHYNEVNDVVNHGKNPFKCHVGIVYDVVIHNQDPHGFISCGDDGTIRYYDLRSISSCNCLHCNRHVIIDAGQAVTACALNPLNPNEIVIGCDDGTIRAYDRRYRFTQEGYRINHNNTTSSISSNSGVIYAFRPSQSNLNTIHGSHYSNRLTCITFNSKGDEILASYCPSLVTLFSTAPKTTFTSFEVTETRKNLFDDRSLVPGSNSPSERPSKTMSPFSVNNTTPQSTTTTKNKQQNLRNYRQSASMSVLPRSNNIDRRRRNILLERQFYSRHHIHTQNMNDNINVRLHNYHMSAENFESESISRHPPTPTLISSTEDNEHSDSITTTTHNTITNTTTTNNDINLRSGLAENYTNDELSSTTYHDSNEPNSFASVGEVVERLVTGVGDRFPESVSVDPIISQSNAESNAVFPSIPDHVGDDNEHHGSGEYSTQTAPLPIHSENESQLSSPVASISRSNLAASTSNIDRLDLISGNTNNAHHTHPTNMHESNTSRENPEDDDGFIASHSNLESFTERVEFDRITANNNETPNNCDNISSSSSSASLTTNHSNEVNNNSTRSSKKKELTSTDNMTNSRCDDSKLLWNDINCAYNPYFFNDVNCLKYITEHDRLRSYLDNVFIPQYVFSYRGHHNSRTMIKECNFYGDDFVMSGSDDGNVFIWDKLTCNIVNVFNADNNVVNCLQPHPIDPVIACSGIDSSIKILAPVKSQVVPSRDINAIIAANEREMRGSSNYYFDATPTMIFHVLLALERIQRNRGDDPSNNFSNSANNNDRLYFDSERSLDSITFERNTVSRRARESLRNIRRSGRTVRNVNQNDTDYDSVDDDGGDYNNRSSRSPSNNNNNTSDDNNNNDYEEDANSLSSHQSGSNH